MMQTYLRVECVRCRGNTIPSLNRQHKSPEREEQKLAYDPYQLTTYLPEKRVLQGCKPRGILLVKSRR
jgi:hypothetical protein